ncbi:CLIP domain-containing serine protease HP8-like [Uranotaenia lowii]|uniref:CLIP domain-containing serine protease HP8-like n=1 Tax=Uranotaenia lowii TaxID=190385 RepID=UPI00247996BB|nr:CLIP domain-containing serine protease HP8-like [Uranotaenia lowii]
MEKVLAIFSLLIAVAVAQNFKSCGENEICVDIRKCPKYKSYIGLSFANLPSELKSMAKANVCSTEKTAEGQVINVCCPTVLNPKQCGVQAGDRISKGTVAKPFEYPWMVLLKDSSGAFVCGGTLISKRYVLTAAHCLRGYFNITSVRLGENDIRKEIDCNVVDGEEDCADPPQDIEVEKTERHPGHSERMKKNDIALIRLKRSAQLSDSVRVICLPNGTPAQKAVQPEFWVVSGWGLTEDGAAFDVLRYARVPPVSQDKCAQRVRSLNNYLTLDPSQICAGGIDAVDNCSGDSGGPLQYVSTVAARYIQYGVVSYGVRDCGVQSEPGVYTNVNHYLNWIVENVDE